MSIPAESMNEPLLKQGGSGSPPMERRPSRLTRIRRRLSHRLATRPKRNLLMTLREWHKRIGLFAFAFMGWLGASGFLINQSADWGYDVVRIDWPWVTALYSLSAEPPRSGFGTGDHWLAITSDHTVLDGQPLKEPIPDVLGLVDNGKPDDPFLFVGVPGGLIMLTADGERYDVLRSPILPVTTVRRVGITAEGAIAVQDLDAFQSHDEGLQWTPVDPIRVRWSQPQALPKAVREDLRPWSRPSVSLEHLLVDAHSGQLFGNTGAWIINLVGLSSMWLAFSGVWMWWRIRRNRRPPARR